MDRSFGYRVLLGGLGLLIADALVQGISFDGNVVQFVVLALIFGLVNALLKPILSLLTCPLMLLTLGLFTLVINALLLALTGALGQTIGIHFVVDNFGSAFIGGIIISIVGLLASIFIPDRRR